MKTRVMLDNAPTIVPAFEFYGSAERWVLIFSYL